MAADRVCRADGDPLESFRLSTVGRIATTRTRCERHNHLSARRRRAIGGGESAKSGTFTTISSFMASPAGAVIVRSVWCSRSSSLCRHRFDSFMPVYVVGCYVVDWSVATERDVVGVFL